ncbi:heat shock protein 70 [Echinococcus multilocularis]|uniref:Heat shock protein 70 n=1 Tax=Echinococcus multilocularis TaxID=6211 RepID=A0A0S4MIP8_ECHMU|nr:heat shock protein 70 [Echinococcus multilocularis]
MLCMDLFSQTIDDAKTTLSGEKLGRGDIHDILLVGGSTHILKVQRMLQGYFNGRDIQRSINPGEAMANGAAVLAAKLSGNMSKLMENLMLYEVTPLDSPTSASIRKFEGERSKASDNFLGELSVKSFPTVPHGVINFKDTYEIDENGILHVSSVEMSTVKQNCITGTKHKARLSEDVELMLADAEKHKQEDRRERSRMAAMNASLDRIYSIEEIGERGDKAEDIRGVPTKHTCEV